MLFPSGLMVDLGCVWVSGVGYKFKDQPKKQNFFSVTNGPPSKIISIAIDFGKLLLPKETYLPPTYPIWKLFSVVDRFFLGLEFSPNPLTQTPFEKVDKES